MELSLALNDHFDAHPAAQSALLLAIRKKSEHGLDLDHHVDGIVECIAKVVKCPDSRRGIDAGYDCETRPHLLAAWRSHVGDPDDQVEQWNF